MRSLTIIILLVPSLAIGQTICSPESRTKLDNTLHTLSKNDIRQQPINELAVEIGKLFLNTDYVEKTLDLEGEEKLVINFIGLDCTTLLETVITLARVTKLDQLTFQNYEKQLELIRYRDGKCDGYASRLHYFTDWIYNNHQKEIIKDITADIGGEQYMNSPSFMSENPQFYPQLSDEKFLDQIKENESEIKSRTYHYVPKEKIEKHEKKIKPGDLIAITISMENLDISHVGFAVEHKGRIHLLHASSSLKKVVISENPLSDYLMGNKSQSGIMVCRLVEPKI